MAWPPQVGEILPRAGAPIGIRRKLLGYSLNSAHPDGGPKAQGFALVLGITTIDIDYLASEIRSGILTAPIGAVREDQRHGLKCVVDFPLRGLGGKKDRVVNLRTVWSFSTMDAPPRLVTAFPKP
jgi:hypothetical protein